MTPELLQRVDALAAEISRLPRQDRLKKATELRRIAAGTSDQALRTGLLKVAKLVEGK